MKKPISATIDTKLIKWLDDVLKGSNLYRNKSHLIEIALEELRSRLESNSALQNKNQKKR